MRSIWINAAVLLDLARQLMDGHIKYGFGSKARFQTKPEEIKAIDCSGFVRYLIYKATDGQVQMPDGSWNQDHWCKTSLLERADYATAASMDGWLRIAFIPVKKATAGRPGHPGHKGHAGHVWLVLNGLTLESHGGKGPDRRPWDTAVLKSQVSDCYKLAQTNMIFDLPDRTSNDLMYA
jgi:hypothetical protein